MTAPSRRPPEAGSRRPDTRHRPFVLAAGVLALGALAPAALVTRSAVEARADGRALLVIAEDISSDDRSSAPWRVEERRADAIVLVRWFRRCDVVEVLSIPRDLVTRPAGETLSITYGVDGLRSLSRAVAELFGVDVFAQLAVDLDDVRALADDVGPVELPFGVSSRDRRTGFAAAPGVARMAGAEVVELLRSRTWEEWRDDQWTLTAADDLGRIARAQAYGRAVVNRLDDFDALTRLRLLAASTRRATIELVDPLAAAGFLLGVAGARDVRFDTVGVQPERTVAERRSPFAANDLGAMARYVLAAGEAARVRSSGCSGMGVTPG